jgi:vesicle coat complex subunit
MTPALLCRRLFTLLSHPGVLALPVICMILIGSGCYLDTPPSPDRAVQILTDLLSDPDKSVRRTAADALGKIGARDAEGALVEHLHDADAAVRAAAARSLGRLPSLEKNAGSRLVLLLADSDGSVQEAAAHALGAAGDMSMLAPSIAGLLTAATADVRRSAAHALWLSDASGHTVIQALVRASQDSDSTVRQWAVAALGEVDATGAAPILMNILVHDPSDEVRGEAAYRLRFIEEGSVVSGLETAIQCGPNTIVARWAQHSLAVIKRPSESDLGPPPSRRAETGLSHQSP